MVLTFIGAVIATSGGVGGGGIYGKLIIIFSLFQPFTYIYNIHSYILCAYAVPIFLFMLGIDSHEAIPMSKAAVMGGAVGNLAQNLFQRHPRANQPLINYAVALALEPMTLLGTLIGVILNVLLSHKTLVVLLALFLGGVCIRATFKAYGSYQLETVQREYNLATGLGDVDHDLAEDDALDPIVSRSVHGAALAEIKAEEARRFPAGLIMANFLMWLLVLVMSLLRGGHGAASLVGIKPCSREYFEVYFSAFPIILAFSLCVSLWLMRDTRRKYSVNYNFQEGDVIWTPTHAFLYPTLSMLAGIAAGLVGIGGGMIKGLLMMEIGMLPGPIAATSAFMVLLTSSSTVFQFAILGLLHFDWSIALMVTTFVASLVGQYIITAIIKATKRPSVILFTIALVVGISTVLLTVAASESDKKRDGNTGQALPFTWASICST